ncbi:potassium channel family protein [Thauera sinica]|uniref:Potassium channel family protein n=1 Tax=Thauera sinica TaxID=2665146 RepID=A0ABW1AQL0_9RHOO|nr:potassium channel protein [Thauera sp. K11]ATE62516.1 potassium channel protein [Thauera sp. K11]
MTPLPRHQSIFFLVLRRMRMPLILLIVIMAISVLGLTLAPGVDADGKVQHLSIFHAFYFISYTATTIGFGEIPYAFSDQQRLWVMISIYLSVIGWAYTLGSLFSLLSDRNLQQAFAIQRFSRSVRRLREPFYLVCGYGETGRLVCDALDRLRHRAVVIELDESRVGEIELQGYVADVPAIAADVRNPETLKFAGLTHPQCVGVIALTNDDESNLAVAISARLLAPKIPVLCRAQRAETAATMTAFGTRHVINPFQEFAETLALALHAPAAWQLTHWLTGLPGTTVERYRNPPRGHWILCGHGRFGQQMVSAMDAEAVPVTIIDRDLPDDLEHRWVHGEGTSPDALHQAGVLAAVGIIAATRSDIDNLSIAVAARELNDSLFVILRQNHYANRALFEAYDADTTVVPSEIIGHECLAILSTPLLVPFLNMLRRTDPAWCTGLFEHLTDRLGWDVPEVWSVRINLATAPALYRRLMRGETVTLAMLLRSPQDRAERLECEVLYLDRDADDHRMAPDADTALRAGDEILLAGKPGSRNGFALTIANEHTLNYVLAGTDLPGGWIWERMAGSRKAAPRPNLP